MIRALAPAIVALALVLAACDDGDGASGTPSAGIDLSPSPSASACSPARAFTPDTIAGSLSSGGLDRTYVLHVPPAYDGTAAMPLVVALHGFVMDAATFANYHELHASADAHGFIVVTPDGTGEPLRWNQGRGADGPDDVAFIRELVAELSDSLCIDENRVYAAGYSNGGGMALVVACEAPDLVAAVAAVAAPYPSCKADVPLIAFHGMEDPVVSFEGTDEPPELGGGVFPPVRRSVSEWAREVGCDGLALISRPSSSVELSTYNRCRGGDGEVLLYTIIGGGHTWPGADLALDVVGVTTQEIDAAETIWSFFSQHPPAE